LNKESNGCAASYCPMIRGSCDDANKLNSDAFAGDVCRSAVSWNARTTTEKMVQLCPDGYGLAAADLAQTTETMCSPTTQEAGNPRVQWTFGSGNSSGSVAWSDVQANDVCVAKSSDMTAAAQQGECQPDFAALSAMTIAQQDEAMMSCSFWASRVATVLSSTGGYKSTYADQLLGKKTNDAFDLPCADGYGVAGDASKMTSMVVTGEPAGSTAYGATDAPVADAASRNSWRADPTKQCVPQSCGAIPASFEFSGVAIELASSSQTGAFGQGSEEQFGAAATLRTAKPLAATWEMDKVNGTAGPTSLSIKCGVPAVPEGQTATQQARWQAKDPTCTCTSADCSALADQSCWKDLAAFNTEYLKPTQCCADQNLQKFWPANTKIRSGMGKISANPNSCKESGETIVGSFSCENGRLTATPSCGSPPSPNAAQEQAQSLAAPAQMQFPYQTCSANPKVTMELLKTSVEKTIDDYRTADETVPSATVSLSEPYLNECRDCFSGAGRRRLSESGIMAVPVELNTYVSIVADAADTTPDTQEEQAAAFSAQEALTSALAKPNAAGKSMMEQVTANLVAEATKQVEDASPEDKELVKKALPAALAGDSFSTAALAQQQVASGASANPADTATKTNQNFLSANAGKTGVAVPSTLPGNVVISLPKADIGDGLGVGAIVGIICGVVIGGLVVGFCFLQKKKGGN